MALTLTLGKKKSEIKILYLGIRLTVLEFTLGRPTFKMRVRIPKEFFGHLDHLSV